MRKLLLLTALSAWPVLSWGTIPSTCDLNSFRQANSCPPSDTSSAAAVAICKAAETDFCANTNAPGCSQGKAVDKVDWGSGSLEDVKAAEPAIILECSNGSRKSMNCCTTGDSSCHLPANSDGATAQAKLPQNGDAPAPTPSGGVEQTSEATKQMLGYRAQWTSGMAGSCKSAKFDCSYRCNAAADDLVKASAHSNCGKHCTDLAESLRSDAQSCDRTEEKTASTATQAFAQASQAGVSADQAGAAKNPDGSTPSTKNPDDSTTPADKTAAKSDGKSMNPQSTDSSMGGMMSGMMQGLTAAMTAAQQQKAAAAAAAATPASTTPDCSNPGTVDPYGRCPATATPAAANSWNTQSTNTAGMQPQSVGKGSINVGNNPNAAGGMNANQDTSGGGQVTPTTAGVVPQGGGGIPGGAGGGTSASLGGGGGGGGGMMVANNKLPQLGDAHGGGGYSAQAAAMSGAASTGGGGWSGYGNHEQAENWNLADFLPGHAKDPKRGLAGGNMERVQIQSKEVNIWTRISDHIKARCTQGLLRDCIP